MPRHRGKARLVRGVSRHLLSEDMTQDVPLRGVPARMRCGINEYVQRELFCYAEYEPDVIHLWRELAVGSRVAVDVGANVGYYSVCAAAGNPAIEVHAFEPTPEIVEAFRANLTLNDLSNVHVNELGVGKSTGRAGLVTCRGGGNNEGMNYVAPAGDGDLDIEMTTLDDYCDQHGVERIDLMKMDIEGGEYVALLGASSMLERKRIDCIFVEFAQWAAERSGSSVAELKELLSNAGFSLWRPERGSLHSIPADRPTENANAIAILRGGRAEQRLAPRLV